MSFVIEIEGDLNCLSLASDKLIGVTRCRSL